MKNWKKIGVLMFVVVFIFVIAACGNNGGDSGNDIETRTLTLGHVTQEGHVLHQANLVLAAEIEERSGGAMTLDIFPAQQLGGEADMMDQVRNGTLDFITPTVATLGARSETFNAWYMPFLLGGIQATHEMMQTDVAQDVLHSLDDSEGIHAIGYFAIDNRHIFSPTRELRTLDDLRGLTVRIPPGPAIRDFYEAVGASPTPVEMQEVYNALQTGVLDAADVDVDAVMSNRYYEVGGYLNRTGHHDWVIPVLFSQMVWDELSDAERTIIIESFEVAMDYSLNRTLELHEQLIEKVQEEGIEIIDFQDMEGIIEIAQQLHEDYAERDPIIAEFIEVAREIGRY